MDEVFGSSVPTFSTGAELEELIRRWLPRYGSRALAAASARLAVQPHNFSARAEQILEDLEHASYQIAAAA